MDRKLQLGCGQATKKKDCIMWRPCADVLTADRTKLLSGS
jgi:hypothetical protein